ncbi:MAG: hypothetical protein COW65_12615 [Cytophagales bacterium CG18_big_fil_WC_8_21_14_2_50_42_9]|nr:MAG: hypothetical protein COW65_12615 [Cytophagales bacterium CG18_big_fil_WC_8_21_14_2_50_42_9]
MSRLLSGEEITFNDLEIPSGSGMNDEEINQKYVKGEVRIVTEQARYPLPSIVTMLDSGNYLLNPEFQRRHRWSILQKSRLIESFIMNVPIPPVFLYEDRYSHYEVMDGLQRLTAIYEFYNDRFKLEGLEQWPEVNGRSYNELPSQIKKGVDRRYLSSIILLQETAKDELEAKKLKQLVFERINSGGVKLEPQESRNAVFNGPFNELCIKLARNTYFCKTWDIPEPTVEELKENTPSQELLENPYFRDMTDVELVLRFFANRQRENLFKFGNTYRQLFDNYLRCANSFNQSTLDEMGTLFTDTIKFVYELLGEKAFFLYRVRNSKWNWYPRPTTAVYDPLMASASEFLEHKEVILSKKETIEETLIQFYKDNYSTFEGRNTNPSVVRERENKFQSLFQSLLM